MKFYFRAFFFRAFYFCAPPFFSFSHKTNFHAMAKKVWFYQTKTSQMLVFCWYLVREIKKNQNMSFTNRAILFSRTFSCANHSNSRGLYIHAGALHENKTHAKISSTKVSILVPFSSYTIDGVNPVPVFFIFSIRSIKEGVVWLFGFPFFYCAPQVRLINFCEPVQGV